VTERSAGEQGFDVGRVVFRGGGHHDGVCTVRFGVRRDDQQDNPVAVTIGDTDPV